MNAEASLSVRLTTARGRVTGVVIASRRPARAASVLSGRAPGEAALMASRFFPVCGVAHGVACARAIEAAIGTAPDARLEAARDLACLGEAASSHVWQLAISWREAAGLPSDPGLVRAARRAVAGLCGALFAPGETADSLRAAPRLDEVERAVATLVALLEPLTVADHPLLGAIAGAGRSGFGASVTRTVARLDVARTGALLATNPAFAELAELDGRPADVSAYARWNGSHEVRSLETKNPGTLLARLAARRMEAREIVRDLAARGAGKAYDSRCQEACAVAGGGAGLAQTARGPLVYWVRATPAAVTDARLVAPTDWVTHPRGVLRDALLGVDVTETLARDAGWLVLALDPCVPWAIEVADA